MKKKILIIHHGEGLGGGLIALLGLIDQLKDKNHIHVLTIFDSIAVDYLRKAGVDVIIAKSSFYKKHYRLFLHSDASYFSIVDCIRNSKNFLTYFLSKYFYAKIELENIEFSFDVVYLNSTFISDWARAAKQLSKKVVIHIREPLSKGLMGLRKSIIRGTIHNYCDRVIAITKDNGLRLGLTQKTEIIYDPVVLKNRGHLHLLNISKDVKYFLYLGGMQRIKGFEQLVLSLKYLNSGLKIFFLGAEHNYASSRLDKLFKFLNPYFWRLNSLISKLKKSDKIIYMGLTDNIFDYYDKSIAVISPFSKPHASLPILEAFSVSKPVIVSNVAGMDELVNSNNGFTFENNNYQALAQAINNLASLDLATYNKLAENAIATYSIIYNNNISVQSILDNM